jgi:hypothetical protein
MKSTWGEIYCYLVLFVTTCTLLVLSCVLISDVYNLYYPPKFEDQVTRIVFHEKSKISNFEWDAPAHKNLKAYASKHYEIKNSLMKNGLFFIFFMFVCIIHVLILRRFKKKEMMF